jgi:hypothetical protein
MLLAIHRSRPERPTTNKQPAATSPAPPSSSSAAAVAAAAHVHGHGIGATSLRIVSCPSPGLLACFFGACVLLGGGPYTFAAAGGCRAPPPPRIMPFLPPQLRDEGRVVYCTNNRCIVCTDTNYMSSEASVGSNLQSKNAGSASPPLLLRGSARGCDSKPE